MTYKRIVKKIETAIKHNDLSIIETVLSNHCNNKYDIINILYEFIGKDGFLPFEHGFKQPIINGHVVWGISHNIIHYNGGKELFIHLDFDDLKTLFSSVFKYYHYCLFEA